MTPRARYGGFLGKVRSNLLVEKGLKYGTDCHGVNLRSTISTEVRQMMREHLEKPEVPQEKEEVFFALVVAVVPSLDVETLLHLYQDVNTYHDMGCVSGEVRGYFMAAIADLGPDQRSAINDYVQWMASRGEPEA